MNGLTEEPSRFVHSAKRSVWTLAAGILPLLCGGAIGCGVSSNPSVLPASGILQPSSAGPVFCSTELDGRGLFQEASVEGVFVRHDIALDCIATTDRRLATMPFRPQSTFKIAHAMIGLETGVIGGPNHVWRWDGTRQPLSAWEQDLDLAGALRESCVPCFQHVARAIGEARMNGYLDRFRYGNADASGPIDQFWLTGPLRIIPAQQVDFVRRSLNGELPVNNDHIELVWQMLRHDHPGLYGKTGLGRQDGRAIGWVVGYREQTGKQSAYALFVRSLPGADVGTEMQRLVPLREALALSFLGLMAHEPSDTEQTVVDGGTGR